MTKTRKSSEDGKNVQKKRRQRLWKLASLAIVLVVAAVTIVSFRAAPSSQAGSSAGHAKVTLVADVSATKAPTPPPLPNISATAAEAEANIVADEDRRLTDVRTVTTLARWQNKSLRTPYRLSTGSGYTLILTPRSTAYTVTDLLTLAPQTFRRLTDGSYLLSENIAVLTGAKLSFNEPQGLTLRLSSDGSGYVTIVSFGGQLEFVGTARSRLVITSWDVGAGADDLNPADGRAHIRSVGGQFNMKYTDVRDLGFWSGRTGGIALTGTDRPNTGAVQRTAKAAKSGVPTVSQDVGSSPVLPTGNLPGSSSDGSGLKYDVPLLSYVSASISDTTITGDAFGLFASGVAGFQVKDSVVKGSLIDGIVLHRWVTQGVIERTESISNAGDGFNLDRATQGIVISESTATANAGSGFLLSGRPLAAGPSATGSSLATYGNNSLTNSSSIGNSKDGIRVLGGFNINVIGNTVTNNDMGIVVTQGAYKISVVGNHVTSSLRHGIAVTKAANRVTITGNIIDKASTGIYLNNTTANVVQNNTVESASVHGISVVGAAAGTSVSYNAVAGHGQSAVDTGRSSGHVKVTDNQVKGWTDTTPWYVALKRLLSPLTLVWMMIAIIVLIGAIRGHRRRDAFGSPYQHGLATAQPSEAATINLVAEEKRVEARSRSGDSQRTPRILVTADGGMHPGPHDDTR